MDRKKERNGNKVCVQKCLDGKIKEIEKKIVEKEKIVLSDRTKDKKLELKFREKEKFTPMQIISNAEELFSSGKLNIEELADGIAQPMPLYNIENKNMMERIISNLKSTIETKGKVIVPSQLLSLVLLNSVDMKVRQKKMSCYFKTKKVAGLSMGRRSYASRILSQTGYIIEHGNSWERTKKEFCESDFWIK